MFKELSDKELRFMKQVAWTIQFCEAYFFARAQMEASEDMSLVPRRSKILDRLRLQREALDTVLAEYRDDMGG